MAGVLTHMVIAQEIMKLLPEKSVSDPGLFYLGNLAPDSIHAREDYVRELKRHTHFRDDIMDKEFELEENRALFHHRVAEFIIKNRDREDGLLDLYRGYAAHVLTDELFMLTIRKEFCLTMERLGIAQNDKRFFEYIITDMNRNDFLLVANYRGSSEIRQQMEQVAIHPIEGYLSEGEMNLSRNWLIRQHYIEHHDLLEPNYISYERTLEFIQSAANSIVLQLSEGGSLPRMF